MSTHSACLVLYLVASQCITSAVVAALAEFETRFASAQHIGTQVESNVLNIGLLSTEVLRSYCLQVLHASTAFSPLTCLRIDTRLLCAAACHFCTGVRHLWNQVQRGATANPPQD